MERKYNYTIAELVDRLSIIQMKQIFISENAKEYEIEIRNIMQDIDYILEHDETGAFDSGYVGNSFTSKMIRASLIIQIVNREIWLNESLARQGSSDQNDRLRFTHSLNGIRNTAKNIIAKENGERLDFKVDSLAADLPKEYGNWNIFTGWEK